MSDDADDSEQLQALARGLPAADVDPATAARIAKAARRGTPLRRRVEVIAVALLVGTTAVWAAIEVWSAMH